MRLVAQISDLHFGRHDEGVVDALVASLSAAKLDLLIVSGDFTQRAKVREFLAARAFLDRLDMPKLVIPGNHDIPLYRLFSRLFRPLQGYDRHIAPIGTEGSAFVDDELAVVGLRTPRRFTGKNGRISEAQLTEARAVLDGAALGALRILVTHHPLAAPPEFSSVTLARRAGPGVVAAIEAGAQILVSGHYHRSGSGGHLAGSDALRELLVVHAGTATSDRRRGEGNSYNLIAWDEPDVTVTVLEWTEATGFAPAAGRSFAWREGRWTEARPGGDTP